VFYELAFHFNPHCAEACNNLGVIYKDRDNLDKAVECYQVMTIVSVVSTLDGFIGLRRFLIAAFFLGIAACFVNQTELFTVIK
jgi:hypothetical protein